MRSNGIVLVVTLAGVSAGLTAQTTTLELGKTISAEPSAGQTDSYSITLASNQFLRALVTEPFRTAVAELYDPDGLKVLEVDGRNFSRTCSILWISVTAGEYRIRVTAVGRYEIQLQELRPAGPDEAKRVNAERLFLQGVSQSRAFAYDSAIASETEAVGLYRDLRDRQGEADALNAVGTGYMGLSQHEKAIGFYQQVLAIRRELKDRGGEGSALNNLGNAYFRLSQQQLAIPYYEQALAIRREEKDHQAEAGTLSNLGNAYYHLSQFEKAIDYYQQALPLRREVRDRVGESQTLNGIGDAYNLMSRNDRAIPYYEEALAIAREMKNRPAEGNSLNNLGNAFVDLSQYEKAIHYFEDALVIRRETKDRRGEGAALQNLGIAYKRLNQYDKAIADYEQALAIYREVKDRQGEGQVVNNIGNVYKSQGRNEAAIPYYEQALAIDREVKDREDEGDTLHELGDSHDQLGHYNKAMAYLRQALAIARETKYRESEGATLGDLADVYRHLRRVRKAASTYAQALAIAREIRDRPDEASELGGLMDLWQAAGQPSLAIFYGKQAVNTIQSMRADNSGLSRDLQHSFVTGNAKPYQILAEILIFQGRLAEAEEVLGLLKEEEFFQFVRRASDQVSSLTRRADLTPDEADWEKRYGEVGDRLMAIGAERRELVAKKTLTGEQQERLDELERDLTVGNRAFEHFLGELTRHFSAKPEVNAKVVAQLREDEGFMADLRELPTGTVAIYTLAGDDKFHAILRTSDAQKAYEYPIRAVDLNRKVFAFRQAAEDPEIDPRPLAQELYRILVGPMAKDLRQARAQTLMWSLDGPLRYLPIAALYDGQQYLIEQYRLSVMTLASNARLKDRPDRAWRAAGFGVTKEHEGTAALPEVASEMDAVGKILHGEIILDEQFTEASMRRTLQKQYPVVHIASHFRFLPGDESKYFFILGDGGHLSLAELKTLPNLFAGVQLLTLSACNTGVGDGTEVEGFGTLAQRQGAKAVVASLWPVADESTSLLMQEFYRARESSPGMTKLEALRGAQMKLLRGNAKAKPGSDRGRRDALDEEHSPASNVEAPRFRINPESPYAHPFYWAPFFLMGNWL